MDCPKSFSVHLLCYFLHGSIKGCYTCVGMYFYLLSITGKIENFI